MGHLAKRGAQGTWTTGMEGGGRGGGAQAGGVGGWVQRAGAWALAWALARAASLGGRGPWLGTHVAGQGRSWIGPHGPKRDKQRATRLRGAGVEFMSEARSSWSLSSRVRVLSSSPPCWGSSSFPLSFSFPYISSSRLLAAAHLSSSLFSFQPTLSTRRRVERATSMDAATPRPQSALPPRRKGPPTPLHIDTPVHNLGIAFFASDSSASASTLSSTTSDADSFSLPSPSKPRSLRNMKKLSITLPSAQSSVASLAQPSVEPHNPPGSLYDPTAKRRPSVISLPNTSTNVLRRKGEDGDGSPTVPYADGPIQILPGIWLGSEDNVRDWRGLRERGIKSVLNVAKEVQTDFDQTTQPLRPFMSTPDLNATIAEPADQESTYRPAHLPSGRPAMHYLKLHWSHGQADLVTEGFPAAFTFVDQALERGDGVLVQCVHDVS